MKEYNTLDDFDVKNKTVLLRVDFNMPLDKKTLEILDTTRIKLVLPTIEELLEKNAKIVVLAHQGRQGSWDFTDLDKHADALQQLLGKDVKFIDDVYGEKAVNAIRCLQSGEILMLNNVRSCEGRLMEKEITTLEKAVKNPDKPSIFLFGGAKFSDVVVTIDRILKNKTADNVLLTGLPAHAFLKADGHELGEKNETALSEEGSPDQFKEIEGVFTKFKSNIDLPIDFAVSEGERRKEIDLAELPVDKNLFDIGEKTIKKFKEILTNAKTIFLSGPCGVFENPLFRKGTEEIFNFVANSKAFSIVGGGHTVAAIEQLNLRDKISHISTGGGSLEKFMMGEKLPVVEALKNAKKRLIEYH